MSRLGVGGRRLLASSGGRPRTLQNTLYHAVQALTTENVPAPSVDGAEAENPWFGGTDPNYKRELKLRQGVNSIKCLKAEI